MRIRVSTVGLLGSSLVAAMLVMAGCGGDKKTDPLADGGASSDVGGSTSTSNGGSTPDTSSGGGTSTPTAGGATSANGGTTAIGGAAAGYAVAGNGAYICRKGVPTGPAISPGTNGVWGSSSPVAGGTFAPYFDVVANTLVPDTSTVTGSVVLTASIAPGGYSGYGIYFKDPEKCWDASQYTGGIRVTIGGSAGGGAVYLQVQTNSNYPIQVANNKGACVGDWQTCSNNQAQITPIAATPTAVDVPWASLTGGKPSVTIDPSEILGIQWQVNCIAATDCAVNLTIGEVTFY